MKAKISYTRISPQKLRLLTAGLRLLSPDEALKKLQFYRQRGRDLLAKLIKQGVANAKNNFKIPEENLIVERLEIGEGPRLKRMDKSHGARFDRGLIKKRSSRILLVLKEKEVKPTEKSAVIKKAVKRRTHPPSPRLRRTNGTKN